MTDNDAIAAILGTNPFDTAHHNLKVIEANGTPEEKEGALLLIQAISLVVRLRKMPETRKTAAETMQAAHANWMSVVLDPYLWTSAPPSHLQLVE